MNYFNTHSQCKKRNDIILPNFQNAEKIIIPTRKFPKNDNCRNFNFPKENKIAENIYSRNYKFPKFRKTNFETAEISNSRK